MTTAARLTAHGSAPRLLLFPHDGKTVRKEIAGYADYVRRLHTEGFGAC